jgi:tyrosyl-tRNA synthetase
MINEGVLKNPVPEQIFGQHVYPQLKAGKVGFRSGMYMASADEMTRIFLINNTRIKIDEIDSILKENNARDAKMITAKKITAIFHEEEAAVKAENNFISKVQKKEAPEDTQEINLGVAEDTLFSLLKKTLHNLSGNEIKRLITQKAVRINGEVKDDDKEIIFLSNEALTLNVGKRIWLKIKS